MSTASWLVTMLLPTPPLPETTPKTFPTRAAGLCSFRKDWGWVRSAQLSPQVLQSWVHSDIVKTSPLLRYDMRDIQGRGSAPDPAYFLKKVRQKLLFAKRTLRSGGRI